MTFRKISSKLVHASDALSQRITGDFTELCFPKYCLEVFLVKYIRKWSLKVVSRTPCCVTFSESEAKIKSMIVDDSHHSPSRVIVHASLISLQRARVRRCQESWQTTQNEFCCCFSLYT